MGIKLLRHLQTVLFLSEHLKKWDDAAHDNVLKDVSKFIKKIESMTENINLSLFREFFKTSPVDYAKYLINSKNTEGNKEFITEAKNTISDLKTQ